MSSRKPREGGPKPHQTFTPAQKLELLTDYEQAAAVAKGGASLRRKVFVIDSRVAQASLS